MNRVNAAPPGGCDVSDARGPLLLLAATGAALALANSPLADAYEHALHPPPALGLTVHHFVNDALMAVFFLPRRPGDQARARDRRASRPRAARRCPRSVRSAA
jgi:hypothetical protein